jgi:hypothetical protein
MAVKLIHSKPPVSAPLVDVLKTALARAESGEVLSGIVVLVGKGCAADFSFSTEDEPQTDALLGFIERVVKPVLAETYTTDNPAAS